MKLACKVIPFVLFAVFFAAMAAAMAAEAWTGFLSGPPTDALNAFLSGSEISYYQIPYITLG